jgi:nucleoside-diphosphate-sugar epimerase
MHKSKTAKTEGEIQRSGPLERLKVYLKVLGPGLITGAADDDPSGIATYSQTGAHPVQGTTEVLSADLSDKEQTIRAVAGSVIVYLLVGLKYDHKLWAEQWPRIMANAIEACKRASAKLIFFDNLYVYGKVSGTMTEETPFNPCSKKGEIRVRIANSLINEWKAGSLTGMIARAADFYGPNASNGIPNILVFEPLSKNRRASWLANDSVPHS